MKTMLESFRRLSRNFSGVMISFQQTLKLDFSFLGGSYCLLASTNALTNMQTFPHKGVRFTHYTFRDCDV